MEIVWKDIQGYEGLYQVSNTGLVKSLPKQWINCIGKLMSHNGIILKHAVNSDGYQMVALSKDKTSKTFRIHRLVASAFIDNPNAYSHIDHIDSDKQNNCVDNLRWCTGRQNAIWKNENKVGKSSKFVGVDFLKRANKYRARIIVNGFQKSLGYFKNEEDARNAYIEAIKLYDEVKG